jgi:hypothetical protein
MSIGTSTTTYSAVTSNWTGVMAVIPSTNYLRPNSFKFQIAKLPNVTFTCQSANLPQLSLGAAMQQTPFVDIPHPGDKVSFGEFIIQFLINEDMSNYKELYDWVASIGVPSGGDQYGQLTRRANVYNPEKYNNAFSDAALLILDSNNRPVVRLNFEDLWPTSVEGLNFDITSSGMEYFVGTASFRYKVFTIQQL